jgi:hypothetical protein
MVSAPGGLPANRRDAGSGFHFSRMGAGFQNRLIAPGTAEALFLGLARRVLRIRCGTLVRRPFAELCLFSPRFRIARRQQSKLDVSRRRDSITVHYLTQAPGDHRHRRETEERMRWTSACATPALQTAAYARVSPDWPAGDRTPLASPGRSPLLLFPFLAPPFLGMAGPP